MGKNYYDILGVDKNADEKEIKKSYKKLALQWHPDKFATKSESEKKEAEDKFKEITEAYDVLSDSEKRKKYDFQQSMGNRNGWYSPFSGFGDNIWGGFGRQEPQKEVGGDIYVNLNVSLQDIYKQKHIEFKYNKRVPCNHCNGTGAENGKLNYCSNCGGTGVISNTKVQGNAIFTTQTQCPKCNGKGKTPEKICTHCNGEGLETIKASISIVIPSEVFDNSSMMIRGEGDLPKSQNGIPGNLIIVFHIKEDDYFKVENKTLVHEEIVPLIDCLIGCNVKIKTINGGEKEIKLNELTENNKKYEFNDVGMWGKPYIVRIKYKMPDKLTDKQKNLLKEFNNA